MDINILKSKYSGLVLPNRDMFIKAAEELKSKIDFKNLPDGPILIYNDGNKKPLYFLFCVYLALKNNRTYDYAMITGRQYTDQKFMPPEDRSETYRKILDTDIAFISISPSEVINDYMLTLISDLVELRYNEGLKTIVYFDTTFGRVDIKNLVNYFNSNGFSIIDIGNKNMVTVSYQSSFFTSPSGNDKDKDSKGGLKNAIAG